MLEEVYSGYIITYLMSHLDFDLYSKVDVVSGSSIGGILTFWVVVPCVFNADIVSTLNASPNNK